MSSDSKPTARQVKCPQCGLLTFYSPENTSRPFCSDRCRLIDLGEWADQSYKIPVPVETLDLLDDADEIETED